MRIEVQELEHRFDGATTIALAPLTHSFEPGTLTIVTGPSCSGKSTLLALLALMLRPFKGSVRWGGEEVQSLSDAARASLRADHLGFVFQDAMLDLSKTVLDNVLEAAAVSGIAPNEARERAEALLRRFDVDAMAQRRPGQVSGGQAQRIALCRALVRSPSVLFADEPTGNLDATSAAVVWRALEMAAGDGATVVAVTHDAERARAAPRHVKLRAE